MTDRLTERHEKHDKPSRPADHRCACCGTKVADPLDDDAHVCVPDEKGTHEYRSQRWRSATAKEARDAAKARRERDARASSTEPR